MGMNLRNIVRKIHFRAITFYAIFLSVITVPALADTELASTAGSFAPVPVYFIYPPVKSLATADDDLVSGRVVEGQYAMIAPASKPWRIAFLFPHLKDPYWVSCDYGIISEAKRLGVAVDIFPADGYDDLVGQLLKMDEVIAKKYDAIVISPISLKSPTILRLPRRGLRGFLSSSWQMTVPAMT